MLPKWFRLLFDLEEQPDGRRETGVEAQAAVLATGFDYFDAGKYGEYGYGTYQGVMISIEFEEMLKEWKNGLKRDKSTRSGCFY